MNPGVYVFDLDFLAGFAAQIADATATELGVEMTEENWPAVGNAVRVFIQDSIDRAIFRAQASADIDALPTTSDSRHLPEFGGVAPLGWNPPV